MSKRKEEKFFEEWYDKNEKRFHHGQFSEKQIAYSAFVNGFNYNREIISELKQQNMQLQTEYNESKEYNSKLAKDNLEFIKENAKLEQQNKELLEFAKEMRDIGMLNPDRLPEYTDIIYHHANDLITRITGGERDE